jgi:predicted RNA-binding Zn-ribbon protein involved in translation (DUF1610 family)
LILLDNAWNRYRFGKRLLWAGLLLFLPFAGGAAIVLERFGLPELSPVPAATWMLGWIISGLSLSKFDCPNCGKRSFMWDQASRELVTCGRPSVVIAAFARLLDRRIHEKSFGSAS